MDSKNSLAAFALFLMFLTLASSNSGRTPSSPRSPKPSTPTTPSSSSSTNPTPTPGSSSSSGTACPRDALKLGVCADLLGSLLNVTIGTPPVQPCCSLLDNLLDLEAAICLCTAIKANILGINLNLPVNLSLLLNVCSRNVPRGFQCS